MPYMDYLTEMMRMQENLQKRMIDKYGYAFGNNEEFIIKNARWAQDELSELVNELKSYDKPWRHGEVNINEVKEEAIDVLHFLLNIFIALDMNAEDVYAFYITKHTRNAERFELKNKLL